MTNIVGLNTFPDNVLDALALLYVQKSLWERSESNSSCFARISCT